MSKQREALEMALDAFNNVAGKGKRCNVAIAAIKKALAEPEPKPVVWIRHENEWVGLAPKDRLPIETPRPDARKPLTDEQIDAEFNRECWVTVVFADGARGIALDSVTARDFARAIERAHGIGVKHE